MIPDHSSRRRVEFSDTDMAGIVHFSRYFCYVEAAEHDFFRKLGFSVHHTFEGKLYGWPRVKVEAEYLHPLKFENEIEVQIMLVKLGTSSLSFAFSIIRTSDQLLVSRGMYTTSCVVCGDNGVILPVPIPSNIADALKAVLLNSRGHQLSKRAPAL